jgi:asparagine synthase (glutamine-hydrolysing)
MLDPTIRSDASSAQRLVATMRDRLTHRGPDDAGLWLDRQGGFAVGFRRLAIVDLSAAGHQPMLSASGRYAMALNGEIYNHAELRAEIEAAFGPRPWRGHSDTEVLTEAVALWGVEAALGRVNGMFALAVWDRATRALWLARDRIGEKPLYYGRAGRAFVFASELKALWPHPRFDASIDAGALAAYLQLGYVPGGQTIFGAVSKLRPGHLLRLDPDSAATAQPRAYWCLKAAAHRGLDDQAAGRTADADEVAAVVDDAVRLRMAADVPVGAFLSGGIDSSLVTALMTRAAPPGAVRSFSIGFEAAPWDEAGHARTVATHLGTSHAEARIGAREAMAVVADLPAIYDEPFADDSMVPTTLLCRLARQGGVTVALSGDGGDELFAGYDRYPDAARWLARRDALPAAARPLASAFVRGMAQPLARRWGSPRLARRLGFLGALLADGRAERFNELLMTQGTEPGALMAASDVPRHPLLSPEYGLERSTAIDRMTFMDSASYLTDDILVKVDRASMAASLEVRCPLLDHRLIELSWRLPTAAKTAGGVGKLPLREMLYRHVPRVAVDRPKQGFGAPVGLWLREEMRDWGEALMSRQALGSHGLLDVNACRRVWNDFAVRGRPWNAVIWRLLMFQAWHAAMTAATVQAVPERTYSASAA